MPDLPSDDITNAPLDTFVDPQSGIANILNQMQAAADRSRPIDTIQHANRVVPSRRGDSVDDYIRLLLEQR